ncbi:hypothetical protein [Actinomadura sp. B10D3]|uniref:hypothetical protein n=1 Tax=Actinomadura sp. B10D3 TaxID=3153557 RepID=UPI00325F7391
MTLGRRAYRWPLRVFLVAIAAGLAVSLSTRSNAEAWDPEKARQVIAAYGGGAALVALAAVLWAFRIHRARLIVTIGEKGVTLRRGRRKAVVPAGTLRAVGITWPVTDPVWTLWLESEAGPDVAAVARTDGCTVTLLRSGSLPSGWLEAVRAAATGTLGVAWRVVDDEGEEVPAPGADALPSARCVLVDGRGRYRDQNGAALLAVACGRLAKPPGGRSGMFPMNPAAGRRTVVLRDPHARTLLVFRRRSRLLGRGAMRVHDADGHLLGVMRGGQEPSFHATDGMLLGSTRPSGDGYAVTGVDGRRSATLRTRSAADDSRMYLERSPSAPDPLRTLVLALPLMVRMTRQL